MFSQHYIEMDDMRYQEEESGLMSEELCPETNKRQGLASRYGTTTGSTGTDYGSESQDNHGQNDYSIDQDHRTSFVFYRKQGNLHIFCEWLSHRRELVRTVILGPNLLCVALTYAIVAAPYLLLVHANVEGDLRTVLVASVGVSLVLLSAIVISDPGLARTYERAEGSKWAYCVLCKSHRPPNTAHCSACDACIDGQDHHCVWVGKCIGIRNKVLFKCFTISLSWLVLVCVFFVCVSRRR